MSLYSFQTSWKCVFLFILLFSFGVEASMPEQDYRAALQLAEKKVQQQKQTLANPQALSSTLLRSLFGRYYQVGDTWDVAAWHIGSNMMRMTGDADHLRNTVGNGGVFHYEVISVKTGLQPQVVVQVTQTESNGLKVVDPKVVRLTLTMNDQLMQSEKLYYLQGNSNPVHASPEGIHSSISPLDLFPLDVPEVATANRQTPVGFPALPTKIKEFFNSYGLKPDLSKSAWFEQDDFFGRPVQILWEQGNPWPSYFKTPGGIAILIHKGTL
jgi:hypothetical protein